MRGQSVRSKIEVPLADRIKRLQVGLRKGYPMERSLAE